MDEILYAYRQLDVDVFARLREFDNARPGTHSFSGQSDLRR